MTRDERRRQAVAAIAMCERVAPRMKAQGELATLGNDQLDRTFSGVELRAAKWLCYVAQRCAQSNKRKKELA